MPYSIKSSYDPKTNIALMIFEGKPQNNAEIDEICMEHLKVWGNKDHKVWVISDITNFEKGDYALISYYASKILPLRRKKAAMTVMVTGNINKESNVSVKLYEFVTSEHVVVAKTIIEATRTIMLEQEKRGMFVPLD
jgi:hypothetical protein